MRFADGDEFVCERLLYIRRLAFGLLYISIQVCYEIGPIFYHLLTVLTVSTVQESFKTEKSELKAQKRDPREKHKSSSHRKKHTVHMMPRLSSVDAESEGSLLNDASNAVVDGKKTSWSKKWVNRGGIRQLLLGQCLSVLMAGTGITSTYLADMCFKAPTFQSLGNYVMLASIFVPVSLFSQLRDDNSAPPPRGRCFLLKPTWWPFALLALIDIEANYLVVLAFEYTSVTSIMLLDCLTIPSVIILSYIFLNYSYSRFHVLGASICVLGVVLIVLSDFYFPVNKDEDNDDDQSCGGDNAARKQALLGDFICICGALLYGVSNVIQETLIKSRGPWEYLARLGIFGTVFGVIQVLVRCRV